MDKTALKNTHILF